MLFFDTLGKLAKSWGAEFPGAHGLAVVEEGGKEYLWLVDHDTKEVVKTTLDGRRVLNLERPQHPAYGVLICPSACLQVTRAYVPFPCRIYDILSGFSF